MLNEFSTHLRTLRSFIPRSMRNNILFQQNLCDYNQDNDEFNIGNQRLFGGTNNLNSPQSFTASSSLEYLLSIPERINPDSNNEEYDNNKLSIYDFRKRKLDKFKEELLYYYSSPDTLLKFKSSIEEEKFYDFYKNIDCENFMDAQKERIKAILSQSKSNLDSQMKISKLSNYNNSFCAKATLINGDKEILINANLIGMKLDECYFWCKKKEIDENKLLSFLNDLQDIFEKKPIKMKSVGLIHFNFIENNLILILDLIENKFAEKNNTENLTKLILKGVEILKTFNSIKLYFFIINLFNQHQELKNSIIIEPNQEIIQFIPNTCFDFNKMNQNANISLIEDLRKPLSEQVFIIKNFNQIQMDYDDYRTLNYDDFILFFFHLQNDDKNFFYYKINLIERKFVDIGQIKILNETEEKNKDLKINDLNISLKNELIYIFYIIENNGEYSLKYKLYNKNTIDLVNNNEIKLEKNFIPKRLYNDNNYLYCISSINRILMIKRNPKVNKQKYINCKCKLYEKDLKYNKEISELELLPNRMYNSLSVNNLFIVNNIDCQTKYLSKFVNIQNDNYILYLYENNDDRLLENRLKVTYNDNIFVITKIIGHQLFFEMTSKDFNSFIDKGISLLPFSSSIYNNKFSNNLYEYLLEGYSSFLNLCGNFDLLNAVKEQYLINFPFSICCNFDQNNLYCLIQNLIKNDGNENIQLYFLIIIKQAICSLFNSEILNEDIIIKDLIPYFKKLIKNGVNSKENKLFNKLLKEIIDISTYIKNSEIIQINEIEFVLEKDYNKINYKSKFLLIELLLKQNRMQKPKELYEYIIQLEKNYLKGILENDDFIQKNDSLSNYYLYKQLMINASEILYKSREKIKNELIAFIPCLSESIQLIAKLYIKIIEKKVENNPLEKFQFIYNSFVFRSFFIIIENLIANKICLKSKESIVSIYKTILILDKININKSEFFDLNNIIEIRNYSFLRNNEENRRNNRRYSISLPIKLKKPIDIIIKTSFLSYKELYNSIKIKLSYDNIFRKVVNLETEKDFIYHNVFEINIELSDNNINNKNDFFINIIPLKDEKKFYLYKNNNDIKIISLIQKAIIHYLLFIFEDINSQIDKYNYKQIVKRYRKVFQTELFKFMSIPLNESINNCINVQSPFNDLANKLLEKLNETIGGAGDFSILNNNLIDDLRNINKDVSQKNFDFLKIYDIEIKKLNKEASFKRQDNNTINDIPYNKLFNFFNYDLSKKNRILSQIKSDNNLDSLINSIFLFGIKYYNYYEKLDKLQNEVEKFKIENVGDIQKYINEAQLIENYKLLYSFYEASSEIKNRYNNQKNEKFKDSTFEEDKKKYFDENLKKVEFLYNSIIPCDDITIKPNISIINNLIDLIDNNNFGIYEIKKYSEIQNINSQIKLIELSIINNLLLYLNSEDNIILLLNLVSKKIRNAYNKLNSFFDNTYGADYFIMEKLKYQFHLLLNILSDKINNNQYSTITKISLSESLMWIISGRNFPILLEIMKVFKDIKKPSSNDNDLFIFESNNIYNVNYFNERKNKEIKFEVFKILVYQIINKIKDILKYKKEKENENKLQLERNPSNASFTNFNKIFDEIVSYFIDIDQKCFYYNEMILFFYKIFINSDLILDFLLNYYPNVIGKILKIAFDNEENLDKKIKLINLKILYKILVNINEDNLDDLTESINNFEKENLDIKNPLIYLYNKTFNQLNTDNETLIFRYYINILIICLNKILEIGNDENIIKNLINDKMTVLNILLLSDNFPIISENQFIIKNNINIFHSLKFEEVALFSSRNNKPNKTGQIICFLDDNFNNYNDYNRIAHENFDKISFNYSSTNSNNKYKKVFIIMNDYEQFDINNLEIKDINDIAIIKNENKYKALFISKNSTLIINNIKELLIKDILNEKGLYYILKILSELIKHLNKEDLIIILKYLWNLYDKNKEEENNYAFMSFEFIEKQINQYFDIFDFINIKKIKDDKKNSLYSLFNYRIKDNSLEIYLNQAHIYKSYKIKLYKPFDQINGNNNIDNIYHQEYEPTDLSFFIDNKRYKTTSINDNSILFTDLNLFGLFSLSSNLKQNINKIKVIISTEKIDKEDIINFINNYKIAIYLIEDNIFKKLIDYFIGGIGANYIILYNDNKNFKNDDTNIFNIYQIHLDNNNIQDCNKKEISIYNIDKINQIKAKIRKNELYKTQLCYRYDEKGYCYLKNKCNFAHGEEELEEIERIKIEMKNEHKEKEKKIKNNIDKIYNDLKEESKKIFNILNIKLSKRLIYEILYLNIIKLPEAKDIFISIKNIEYIYETLCMEYYFNIRHNISAEFLRKNLINYFIRFSNDKEIKIVNNEWIKSYLEQIDKLNDGNYLDFLKYLANYDIKCKPNNEKQLLDINNSCPSILYDKLLFLSEHFANEKNNDNEYLIKYSLIIFEKIIKKMSTNNLNYNDNTENYYSLFLSKILDIIYNHFINKKQKENSNQITNNNIIIEESFMPKNIEETMKNLSKIVFEINDDLKKYAFIEIIHKYLDLLVILFFREKQSEHFEYWLNSENKLFNPYCNYKILTMERYYNEKDYKEMAAFILSFVDSKTNYNNKLKNNNTHLKMKINYFNEYKLNVKSPYFDITFKNLGQNKKDNSIYNKIVIFCFDEKNKKYIFQDIVDLNNIEIYDNIYNLRVNNNIYLVPLKGINTDLYSFQNKTNLSFKSTNINSDYINLSKYDKLPKFCWNIGYDGNNYLLLSEEDNQIYNFKDHLDSNQITIKEIINLDSNIKKINSENNRIIGFIGEISNGPSLLYRENGDIYCLGDKYNYQWLNNKEKIQSIEYPIKIPNIRILSLAANNLDCYAIGMNGNLYENKEINNGRQWVKVELPQNNKKFLQCTCGDGYVLCLVQDNKGKGKIYAKGKNNDFQCGIISYIGFSNEIYGNYVPNLTECEIKGNNLDFKSVFANKKFSAALTKSGKLYVWGLKDNDSQKIKPTLVNKEEDLHILVDNIYLNNGYLFALCRVLENGNYIKKLFSLEYESKQDKKLVLKEIKIMNIEENNSRIIPIKILIGKNKSYCLCINESKLIEDIREMSTKNENNYESEILIESSIKYQEEKNLENLRKKYSSNILDNFINLFNSLSDKNIQALVKAFEDMKEEGISIDDIFYEELINYLKGKEDMNDLLSLFLSNENNNGKILYDYLKIRISLVDKTMKTYLDLNNLLKSEGFPPKIITNNISYLDDNLRIKYFNSLLLNLRNKNNRFINRNQIRKGIIIDRKGKANNFKEKYNANKIPDTQLKETVFGQLYHYYEQSDGKDFLLERGDKLFTVTLINEPASDAGGPYREIFSNICEELQSEYIELFIINPNNKSEHGELRDKYILNPNAKKHIYLKAFEFIGKLMGLAISTNDPLSFNLHPIIWKSLLDNKIYFEEYITIDNYFYNIIQKLEKYFKNKDEESLNQLELNFVIKNSNNKDIELKENGEKIKVTLENLEEFITLAKKARMNEINEQIQNIKNGLYSVIEGNILKILNWKQLELMVCGNPIFDIEEFKKNTKYRGYNFEDNVINWFWEWLEKCKEEDKFKYLKYVSGYSRLPNIQYDHIITIGDDLFAHTCAFQLELPKFKSKKELFENMQYAIEDDTYTVS